MRKLKYLIIVLIFVSCHTNEKYAKSLQHIEGDWYSIKNGTYLEYYIDKNTMYTYSAYANNINKYDYKISNDSIYVSYIDDGINYREAYKFYSKIIDIDSMKTVMTTRELNKLKNAVVTLKMVINKEVDLKTYESACIKREKEKMVKDN
ncbi:MAG: hypothetical protein AAFX55_01985 [Bacteroidota bacterium]